MRTEYRWHLILLSVAVTGQVIKGAVQHGARGFHDSTQAWSEADTVGLGIVSDPTHRCKLH